MLLTSDNVSSALQSALVRISLFQVQYPDACAADWQAGISLLMAAILVIWTAVTFRQPLPRPLPDNLGVNYSGLSSIAVMPISLFSASIFR